jgi:rhodanese-related sulfurtransferase
VQFVQHNIWLILLAVSSGIMLIWPAFGRRFSGVNDVGALEATQLINHRDALVLDVREEKEYSAGHIANAKHIPLGQLASRVQDLEKYRDKPIVVNCRSGARSASACGILKKQGFSEVYNLRGGIMAWEQSNMPVEK